MTLSPDLIANIIFGVIMTSIGIAALWAVRWQAFFLRRHQSKAFHFQHLPYHSNIPLLDLIQDEEQALRLSRANSDASAGGNNTLVLHPESVVEDRPAPFGARARYLGLIPSSRMSPFRCWTGPVCLSEDEGLITLTFENVPHGRRFGRYWGSGRIKPPFCAYIYPSARSQRTIFSYLRDISGHPLALVFSNKLYP